MFFCWIAKCNSWVKLFCPVQLSPREQGNSCSVNSIMGCLRESQALFLKMQELQKYFAGHTPFWGISRLANFSKLFLLVKEGLNSPFIVGLLYHNFIVTRSFRFVGSELPGQAKTSLSYANSMLPREGLESLLAINHHSALVSIYVPMKKHLTNNLSPQECFRASLLPWSAWLEA